MFLEERNFFPAGLSLEAIYQSSGSSFRAFFVKTTKESEQPFWNHSIAAARAVLPIPNSACSVFMCPNKDTAANALDL